MDPRDEKGKIWYNGKYVDWWDAKIHVMSHAVHYGTSFFEGIRCYDTQNGPAIFRLDDHIERFFNSAKIYRTEIPFSQKEITCSATKLISSSVSPGKIGREITSSLTFSLTGKSPI